MNFCRIIDVVRRNYVFKPFKWEMSVEIIDGITKLFYEVHTYNNLASNHRGRFAWQRLAPLADSKAKSCHPDSSYNDTHTIRTNGRRSERIDWPGIDSPYRLRRRARQRGKHKTNWLR